jgi:hypothetical protein
MPTSDVLYTGRWSDQTRLPFPDVGWYDEGRARRIYEDPSEFLCIVDAAEMFDDGRPLQRWVIGASGGGFRCAFYTPAGTLYRQIDYVPRDGRLWRDTTLDYTYPDSDNFYLSGLESLGQKCVWWVPDFTVEAYEGTLRELDAEIRAGRPFVARSTRHLIVARRA